MPEENKNKFALWIYPDTQKRVDQLYKSDNCKSRSEFIEKAIKFYCGYISAENALEFLPTSITSAVSGAVQSSENRMARLLCSSWPWRCQ
jgi:metal-responsive CopG/Arc/MetJ family transcriptional regulator